MSDLPEGIEPFDRDEIQSCEICGKGVMHSGAVEFYELTIRQVVVDFKSVRQIVGMEMMTGHPEIARIMAPTSRVGIRMPAKRVILCHDCFLLKPGETAAVFLWDDS